jgi:hypothetical protein
VLFWNEGRAVKRYKALVEGAASVVTISSDQILPENESKLVHTMGFATTGGTIHDPVLPVSVKALRYQRTSVMYQWEEQSETKTKKKIGGGEKQVTTYTYNKIWSKNLIDHTRFKKSNGHENPTRMPYGSVSINAQDATLGAFALSPALLMKIDSFEVFDGSSENEVPVSGNLAISRYMGGYYIGSNPESPAVGDVKISFEKVAPLNVSVIGAQYGNMIVSYTTANGGDILELAPDNVDAQKMFKMAHNRNTLLTWGVSLGGLFAMFFGFMLMFRPISVFADVLPVLGSVAEAGLGLISFILALTGTLTVVAIAWIYYRPVLGISLIAVGVVLIVWLIYRSVSKKNGKKTSSGVSEGSFNETAPVGNFDKKNDTRGGKITG